MAIKTAPRPRLASIILLFSVGMLTGCIEKGVKINLAPEPDTPDTSYVSTVEPPQQRIVLMEEFTGVSCPPCPSGHKMVKSILDSNPDKVAVVAIQPFGFFQAAPVTKDGVAITKRDNRSVPGTALSNEIYGKISSMPASGVDRLNLNGSMYIDKSFWSSKVTERLKVPTSANVYVSSSYDGTKKKYAVKVKVAYTASVSKRQTLNVALTEDGIIDAQEVGLDIDTAYEHMHILRDLLTAPAGNVILAGYAIKAPGLVYETTFFLDLTATPWVIPDKCMLIAYLCNDDPGDRTVQQSAFAKLK